MKRWAAVLVLLAVTAVAEEWLISWEPPLDVAPEFCRYGVSLNGTRLITTTNLSYTAVTTGSGPHRAEVVTETRTDIVIGDVTNFVWRAGEPVIATMTPRPHTKVRSWRISYK